RISARMLKQSWKLRPQAFLLFFFGALIETGGSIAAIYAGARLSGLLASFVTTGSTDGVWLWFWVTILTGTITGLGFLAMAYAKRELYYSFIRWSVNGFLGT